MIFILILEFLFLHLKQQQISLFHFLPLFFRWVHVVCALYVPGVAFGDIDKLRPVTLTEMNYSKYGAKASTFNLFINLFLRSCHQLNCFC